MNLNKVIAEVLAALPQRPGAAVTVVTELAPDLAPADCDAAPFQKALLALLSHAAQAAPPGGQVLLRSAEAGPAPPEPASLRGQDYVVLELSGSAAGSWPGLHEAEAYIRQCGGAAALATEPGAGATVRLYLPRQQAPTVLVVDDQPDVRRFAAEVLAGRGYRVLQAASGLEALELWRARGGPLQLLVADVMLPGMTGQEVAERLCELQPSLKVLLVSGYSAAAVASQGVLAPGVPYLPKPFTPEALIEAAAAALRPGTVLMLDDSEPVRRMQREVLEMGGYEVIEAGTLAEARECFAARSGIDLVLADAYLPDGSGVAFAAEARKSRPELRVILISGAFDDDAQISPRLLRQVDDVLAKPISPEVLLERVRRVLSRQRGTSTAGC